MRSSTTPQTDSFDPPDGEPLSIRHLLGILSAYQRVIYLTLIAVAIAYALVALVVFLARPTERITAQQFRLDFEGAAEGKFPNGLKFSTTDVVNPNILLKVYRQNELARYMAFPNFSRSVFVLESNRAYDLLAAEYQARLADPKLSPVDRERLQGEFEQKRAAISKNEYALNYVRLERVEKIPEPIVRKTLVDILSSWSEYAMKDQDVLAYRVAVLSPDILNPTAVENGDPMIETQMLRTRTVRLLDNLAQLQKLPGAELARGGASRMSLAEVRLRMEEIQRYRIEPLVSRVASSGTATALTMRFLQDQLDYDTRQLTAARRRAESLRDTLAVYEQTATAGRSPVSTSGSQAPPRGANGGDTVMPQINDSFIDRMVDLAQKSADAKYRQKIVDDYRNATDEVIPLEQAVNYDQDLINTVRTSGGSKMDAAAVSNEIAGTRAELRVLVGRMNEIYREISKNVYSTGQLITVTAPPTTRVTRAVDLPRLALWGVVVMLLAIPLTIIGVLIHNRVREEAVEEELAQGSPA